jgi:LPS-assembly lipoprotein
MRNRLVLIVSLMALGGLAGCGFTPMYAVPGVAPGLSAVEVTAPQGRSGFLMRQALDDALAHNASAPPAYRLKFNYTENKIPRGVRVDNVANRYELVLEVAYTLSNTNGVPVKQGRARASVTYDSADQPYASITAEQDGQERAASEIARQIQQDLAVWLVKQRAPNA